jgi:AraC-like DNA-binding protein
VSSADRGPPLPDSPLHSRAQLALSIEPAQRWPLLLSLLTAAMRDFQVDAARSYLDELEVLAEAGEIPAARRALIALHKGALTVLSGKLGQAIPLFERLGGDESLPARIRVEALRALGLVRFEQGQRPDAAPAAAAARAPQAQSTGVMARVVPDESKPGFWRFVDALQASERGDAATLDQLVRALESDAGAAGALSATVGHADAAEPISAYLFAARALCRAAKVRQGRLTAPGILGRARICAEPFGAALDDARAAVLASADRGAARLATACLILGLLEGHGGSPERGVAALLEAERILHPDAIQALTGRAERAWLLIELGEIEAAGRLAEDVLLRAETRGAHVRAAVAQAVLAEVARRRHHPGEAQSRAARALDLLRSGELRGLLRRFGPSLGYQEPAGALPSNGAAALEAAEVPPAPPSTLGEDRDPRLTVKVPEDPRLNRLLARVRVVLLDGASGALAGTKVVTALTATQLARHAGLSREHLSRRMRAELGLPLREVLLREQLAAALPLLSQGLGADEAAQRVGFSDGRALRRALLRLTGRRLRDLRGQG